MMCESVDELVDVLHQIADACPDTPRRWLVTMTGELCDCFLNRKQGVERILHAVTIAAGNNPVSVWSVMGQFVNVDQALAEPMLVASANWHALASWIAMNHPDERLLLIDTGSTTTDLIPILHGKVAASGLTDAHRLMHGELIYLGGAITPLMVLSGEQVPFPMFNEWFANMHDLAVVLGHCHPKPDDNDTPDGQPLTVHASIRRMLRMVGKDDDQTVTEVEIRDMANALLASAVHCLHQGIASQISRHKPMDALVISGSAAWLIRQTLRTAIPQMKCYELDEHWDASLSTCACATAMLKLDAAGVGITQ